MSGVMGVIGLGELSSGMVAINHIVTAFLALLTTLFILANIEGREFISGSFPITLYALIVTICLGLGSAYLGNDLQPGSLRDTLAVVLSLWLGVLSFVVCQHHRIDGLTIWIALLSLHNAPFLLIGLSVGDLPNLQIWYGDRFLGLARNPNQTALLAIVGVSVAALLKDLMPRRMTSLILPVILGNIAVGLFTKSSAFKVAVLGGALTMLLLSISSTTKRWIAPLVFTIIIAASLLIPVALESWPILKTSDEGGRLLRDDSQSEYRIQLWKESISLISKYPIFGRGGGAAGGEFDAVNAYEAMEAHNTVVDLTIATGFVGLILYLGIVYKCLRKFWNQADIVGISSLTMILIYSMFHNLLRQPLLWMVIAICAIPRNPIYRLERPSRRS
jgi:O-antigen ligase